MAPAFATNHLGLAATFQPFIDAMVRCGRARWWHGQRGGHQLLRNLPGELRSNGGCAHYRPWLYRHAFDARKPLRQPFSCSRARCRQSRPATRAQARYCAIPRQIDVVAQRLRVLPTRAVGLPAFRPTPQTPKWRRRSLISMENAFVDDGRPPPGLGVAPLLGGVWMLAIQAQKKDPKILFFNYRPGPIRVILA